MEVSERRQHAFLEGVLRILRISHNSKNPEIKDRGMASVKPIPVVLLPFSDLALVAIYFHLSR
jgi:hypothetical protein